MLALYLNLIDDDQQRIEFEEIYLTYRKQMFLLAKSFLHNDADAEDVVHDVFLRIATKHMKFIQGLHSAEDVRNYLLKATKNTALNELKRKGRNTVSIDTLSDKDLDNARELSDTAFIEMLCTKADYNKVVQALLSLREPYRDIMYYHFVMDLTVPEAAKHLGRSTATAKQQLIRGKKLLLSKLELGGDTAHGNE